MKQVFMKPTLQDMRSDESGIKRVIEAYIKYLPKFGYEVIDNKDEPHDISASHAGTMVGADVAHVHGLYWSADYDVAAWEIHVNANVIASVRYAKQVTVPSAWVAETFQRDMRFTPHIIPHGIELDQYVNTEKSEGYVLWNKNRDADVCSPYPVGWLASRFPKIEFVSTFRPSDYFAKNMHVVGVMAHNAMKLTLQRAAVYLATTKETFGIGILEALAYGIPVLGFAAGGILEMVEHRVNGYLARPNDFDDLSEGLDYCMKYRKRLSMACVDTAKRFTWEAAVEKVAQVYNLCINENHPPSTVDSSVYLLPYDEPHIAESHPPNVR